MNPREDDTCQIYITNKFRAKALFSHEKLYSEVINFRILFMQESFVFIIITVNCIEEISWRNHPTNKTIRRWNMLCFLTIIITLKIFNRKK